MLLSVRKLMTCFMMVVDLSECCVGSYDYCIISRMKLISWLSLIGGDEFAIVGKYIIIITNKTSSLKYIRKHQV